MSGSPKTEAEFGQAKATESSANEREIRARYKNMFGQVKAFTPRPKCSFPASGLHDEAKLECEASTR